MTDPLTLTPELQDALEAWCKDCDDHIEAGWPVRETASALRDAYRAALDAEPEPRPLTRELVETLEAWAYEYFTDGVGVQPNTENDLGEAYCAYRDSSESEPETRFRVGDRVRYRHRPDLAVIEAAKEQHRLACLIEDGETVSDSRLERSVEDLREAVEALCEVEGE